MTWSLRGKTALVTGASAGIGAAMVRALVAEGCRVVATARRQDRLDALATDRALILPVAGDITNATDRARILAAAESAFGPIDLLVNNAGYGQRGPIELVPEEEARRQFEVNLFSLVELTRQVLPSMRRRSQGRILNVSSVVGRVAIPMSGWYAATKHALEAISDSLRLELAPFGIHVVLIEPGPIVTEFQDVALDTLSHLEGDVPAYAAYIEDLHAARKKAMVGWMTAEDCARIMVRAAATPRPRARYPITRLAWLLLFLWWLLPTFLLDALLARTLRLTPRRH
jgi:short-subunit dehydrogenase